MDYAHWSGFVMLWYIAIMDDFAHILRGYFTGIVITPVPCNSPEESG